MDHMKTTDTKITFTKMDPFTRVLVDIQKQYKAKNRGHIPPRDYKTTIMVYENTGYSTDGARIVSFPLSLPDGVYEIIKYTQTTLTIDTFNQRSKYNWPSIDIINDSIKITDKEFSEGYNFDIDCTRCLASNIFCKIVRNMDPSIGLDFDMAKVAMSESTAVFLPKNVLKPIRFYTVGYDFFIMPISM